MVEETFEKVVAAPAIALDRTIGTSKQFIGTVTDNVPMKHANKYWQTLGPGLTTGAADDDPSGIATYSQTGAQYGFQLIWLAVFTLPFMAVVQEMCGRIGLVTGRGLAGTIRLHYPKSILYTCTLLLFIANTLNLGADLGAMAKAIQLMMPSVSFSYLIIAVTILSLALQIFSPYEKYAKYLKWLAFLLFSYVLSALMIHIDWRANLHYFILPTFRFSRDQIFLITAILGTTISPYLFFWQTSQEIEEKILHGKTTILQRQGASSQEVNEMRTDVWSGMFISNIVMFFIIAACAATLFSHGITTINTAADAALALRPLAGENAYLLFAVGIIGAGLLAVPILAGSASYAFSESFGWKFGLHKTIKQAPSFYGIIMISTAIGFVMNFIGIDPIRALLYSAVLNGLVAPVILVLIVLTSSNKKIMGKFANSPFVETVGWFITLLMGLTAVATVASFIL